jgi:hypothetical protein
MARLSEKDEGKAREEGISAEISAVRACAARLGGTSATKHSDFAQPRCAPIVARLGRSRKGIFRGPLESRIPLRAAFAAEPDCHAGVEEPLNEGLFFVDTNILRSALRALRGQ